MPYIKERDEAMHQAIDELVEHHIKSKGDLNYVICELVGQLCLRDGGIGYESTSNWIDAVHGAERELTRRLLNPYENMKCKKNGDLESFIELMVKMK